MSTSENKAAFQGRFNAMVTAAKALPTPKRGGHGAYYDAALEAMVEARRVGCDPRGLVAGMVYRVTRQVNTGPGILEAIGAFEAAWLAAYDSTHSPTQLRQIRDLLTWTVEQEAAPI